MRFEAAMQYLRSGDRTFVHGVNLTEVDVAVKKHLQLFVAWLAGDHARHCVAIFTEDPQRLGHALTDSLSIFSVLCDPSEKSQFLWHDFREISVARALKCRLDERAIGSGLKLAAELHVNLPGRRTQRLPRAVCAQTK